MAYILLMYLGTKCDASFLFYFVCGILLIAKIINDYIKYVSD